MPETPNKHSNSTTEPTSLLKAAIHHQLASVETKINELHHQADESLEVQESQLKLLELIEVCESKSEPGYFRFENWKTFNAKQFTHVKEQTTTTLWKILRIINHGEVLIPTGLIYEISHYLLHTHAEPKSPNRSTLREVINEFLRMNKTKEFLNNFRELSNYSSLEAIQKIYCPKTHSIPQVVASRTIERSNPKQLCDRLHKDGRKREQSIRQMKYASMARELSECKFTPNISNYKSKNEPKKCERICKNHPDPKSVEDYKFIARRIDQKIYEGRLKEVPGVEQHIRRVEVSEAERQRVKRITSRSWLMIR